MAVFNRHARKRISYMDGVPFRMTSNQPPRPTVVAAQIRSLHPKFSHRVLGLTFVFDLGKSTDVYSMVGIALAGRSFLRNCVKGKFLVPIKGRVQQGIMPSVWRTTMQA